METLRCYPLGHLERTCAKEYTFRGTNVTIKPGTLVQMPTVKMMKDEKYYEDPLNFDPTRWSKDSDSAKNPFLLFTFGKHCSPNSKHSYKKSKDSTFSRPWSKELHWKAFCHFADENVTGSPCGKLQAGCYRKNTQGFED